MYLVVDSVGTTKALDKRVAKMATTTDGKNLGSRESVFVIEFVRSKWATNVESW